VHKQGELIIRVFALGLHKANCYEIILWDPKAYAGLDLAEEQKPHGAKTSLAESRCVDLDHFVNLCFSLLLLAAKLLCNFHGRERGFTR